MTLHIAIDIGGTQLRAGLYRPDSLNPVKLRRTPTQGENKTPLDRLIALVESIWPEGNAVDAIGVAAPGPLDPYAGVVLAAPNVPGWNNFPLRQHLEDHFQVPVTLGNDANLAALGEWRYGAGQGHRHLVYLTISTGIGGGVIMDGHLLLGSRGLAAELGHVTIDPNGPLCNCGQRGHLEALASGTAIGRWATAEIQAGAKSTLADKLPATAREVAAAARAGDGLALATLERAGYYLGLALANYLHTFNPTIFVLGGGVSQSLALMIESVRESLAEHVLSPHYLDDLVIATAALGDEAGLIGALVQARELRSTERSPSATG